jgi:signal peptidase I
MNVSTAKTQESASARSEPERSKKHRSKYVVRSPARETVESIVVAFILAFLFRTFQAEPFVIPTGSMADTLNGRHKEVDCEQCGWHYHIGASREVVGDAGIINPRERIRAATCPNCRYVNEVRELPVFQGDRIIVNKFPYEIADPKRWDVIVFKNPEEPTRNFIKRLVGLPNEYLRIDGGDVYARKDETAEWRILRKGDPNKQLQLQMNVYDNDHPERGLIENGWPERWAASAADNPFEPDPSGWTLNDATRSFALEQSSPEAKWLRYRHFVPSEKDWNAIFHDPPLPFDGQPAPKLINDFCGYNEIKPGSSVVPAYWVGDLTLRFRLELREVGEAAALEIVLNKGHREFRCVIDPTSGEATLGYTDQAFGRDRAIAKAATPLRGRGSYSVIFANVDQRLCLWINNKLMPLENLENGSRDGEYDSPPTTVVPTANDLAPVGISLRGATAGISQLKLQRDIYYRPEQSLWSKRRDQDRGFDDPHALYSALDNPERYAQLYREHAHWAEFPPLNADEYFVLGDNSPASLDSRLWDTTHAVPRHDLLGKAFFIYWPHGVPFLNNGEGFAVTSHRQLGGGDVEDYPKLRLPFYPNLKRMERIR